MSDVTDGASTTGETFRLMYLSHDLIEPEDRKKALGALFSQARSNNKRRGITGALLVSGNTFIQTLEGEESVVRQVYETIRRDPRHEAVELLETAASVRVSMRTPPNILTREVFGLPSTVLGRMSERSLDAFTDRMGFLLQRMLWGDLEP